MEYLKRIWRGEIPLKQFLLSDWVIVIVLIFLWTVWYTGVFTNLPETTPIIEDIDPRNVSISAPYIIKSFKPPYKFLDCTTLLYAKDGNGLDIAVTWGIEGADWKGNRPPPVEIKPYMFTHFFPDPRTPAKDMTWDQFILYTIIYPIVMRPRPAEGWFDIDDYSSKKDFKDNSKNQTAALTLRTITIQSKIILDETPFTLTFRDYKTKQLYAFRINPKGLIAQKDKDTIKACETQFLNSINK